MWNSKTAGIDEIQLEAENLNVLLEVVLSSNDINSTQKKTLLGMALNASANVLSWCKAGEARRE